RRTAARRAGPRTGTRGAHGRARSSGRAARPRVPGLRDPARRTRLTLAHVARATGGKVEISHGPRAVRAGRAKVDSAQRWGYARGVTTLPRIKTTGEEGAAPSFAAFRELPRTGVIYVTTEASRRGYA